MFQSRSQLCTKIPDPPKSISRHVIDEMFICPQALGAMESLPTFKFSSWCPCSSRASRPDPEITKDGVTFKASKV